MQYYYILLSWNHSSNQRMTHEAQKLISIQSSGKLTNQTNNQAVAIIWKQNKQDFNTSQAISFDFLNFPGHIRLTIFPKAQARDKPLYSRAMASYPWHNKKEFDDCNYWFG